MILQSEFIWKCPTQQQHQTRHYPWRSVRKQVDQQGHKNWKTTGKMSGESYQFMDDRLQYPPNSLGRCV